MVCPCALRQRRPEQLIMLHDSLKRRWHEPGLSYEPPQKIRRLATGGDNCLDLHHRKIAFRNQLYITDVDHTSHRESACRIGKRKLVSYEDCQSVEIDSESSGFNSSAELERTEYHPSNRFKLSLPVTLPSLPGSIQSNKRKVRPIRKRGRGLHVHFTNDWSVSD